MRRGPIVLFVHMVFLALSSILLLLFCYYLLFYFLLLLQYAKRVNTGEGGGVTYWEILRKVQMEALLWGIGTAIGELPPYFVARTGMFGMSEERRGEQRREEQRKMKRCR